MSVPSEERRELIRKAYITAKGRNELIWNIDELKAHKLFQNVARTTIVEWARTMGLSKTSFRKWTKEEDDFLLEKAGTLSIHQIKRSMLKRGWKRSLGAIGSRICKLGHSIQTDVYTANQVSESLGVGFHVVTRWIKQGKLKAKRGEGSHKYYGADRHQWEILPLNLCLFIRLYPHELVDAKPDVPWMISLIEEFWGKKGFHQRYGNEQ